MGRHILILVIVFGALIFILFQLVSFLLGSKSRKRQLERDVSYLKAQMFEFAEGLIPFEQEEFKILSAHPIVKKSQRAISTFYKGVLSTIYQEPLIAFAFKDTPKEDQIIFLAKSSKNIYKMIFNGIETETFINNKSLGVISLDNILYSSNRKIELARISEDVSEKYATIVNEEKEIAHVNVLKSNGKLESERLFSMFHNFDPDESDEVLILTLYHIFISDRIHE